MMDVKAASGLLHDRAGGKPPLISSMATAPIEVVAWDAGRMLVNAAFAPLLQRFGLTTAASVLALGRGEVYREVGERVTSRHEFAVDGRVQAVYLKRHGPITWRERWKAWTKLRAPVWGARPEWDAVLEFHRLGIPTMTPIACGELDGRSWLLTDALEHCVRLDHWFAGASPTCPINRRVRHAVIERMAQLTRHMHVSGWHHQDLYWCHVLWPQGTPPEHLHVIDLGRVQPHSATLGRRWVIKDLSQLLFSSKSLTAAEKLRFLRCYLGRRLTARDKRLVRRLRWKAGRIERHSQRHGL